jgi:Ca-activated chloride channel family protein
LFLLWFRKGWTLTWNALFVVLIISGPSPPVFADVNKPNADIQQGITFNQWFIDQWLTRDQQGRLLMQLQNYPEAAQRFSNPMWKGMAYYYNEEFMRAAEYFSRSDSNDALFNEANARAQARDYLRAVHRYDRLLTRAPEYPGAADNRATVQSIIDEINLISESQQPEAGVSGENKELDSDDAIPAQGADEITWEKAEVRQLSAEDILQDESTAEMWLRAVQQDPSSFLTIKFAMQLQLRKDRAAPAAEVAP